MRNSPALVLIAFNRPAELLELLNAVREMHQGRVYFIIDGPRRAKPGEERLVSDVVEIAKAYKFGSSILYNIATENLGTYHRIKSGLDWVFSTEEQAIILEDDCIPSNQFMNFSTEMLNRFENDQRVFSISGTNLFENRITSETDAYYSMYHNCWGWATWRRAWSQFIGRRDLWKEYVKSGGLKRKFANLRSYLYWKYILSRTYGGHIDSWAYRWNFTCWMNDGLSVIPKANLVRNIGFSNSATRTTGKTYGMDCDIGLLNWPLIMPANVERNEVYDRLIEDTVYSKSLKNRLIWAKNKVLG